MHISDKISGKTEQSRDSSVTNVLQKTVMERFGGFMLEISRKLVMRTSVIHEAALSFPVPLFCCILFSYVLLFLLSAPLILSPALTFFLLLICLVLHPSLLLFFTLSFTFSSIVSLLHFPLPIWSLISLFSRTSSFLLSLFVCSLLISSRFFSETSPSLLYGGYTVGPWSKGVPSAEGSPVVSSVC